MEAFGNACTSRNSNSSRFGKCVRLALSGSSGRLIGGQVQTYLLEKSRITTGMAEAFGSGERNFHAFYQLLAGARHAAAAHEGGGTLLSFLTAGRKGGAAAAGATATADAATLLPAAFLTELGLTGNAADYRILGHQRQSVNGAGDRTVDDLAAFTVTAGALLDLGCTQQDVQSLFRLLAALLHLGNGSFDDDDAGNARPAPGVGADAIEAASKALGCDGLGELLLHRELSVRGEVTRIDL